MRLVYTKHYDEQYHEGGSSPLQLRMEAQRSELGLCLQLEDQMNEFGGAELHHNPDSNPTVWVYGVMQASAS